jgi:hypothetical protein
MKTRFSETSVDFQRYIPEGPLCGLMVRVPRYGCKGPDSNPALPDFLRSSEPGTGSTQPREYS